MKYPLFIAILCAYSSSTLAQSFTFYNYSLEEGLPSSEVYQAYQDKMGFIWFGTDNGVVRYDGNEMHTFHVKDGLSDPVVFGFQEDDNDRIWFTTYSGKLSYYEKGEIKKYKFNDKISKIMENGIISFTYSSERNELSFMVKHIVGKIDSLGVMEIDSVKKNGLHYFSTNNTGILAETRAPRNNKKYKVTIDKKEFDLSLSSRPFTLDNYNGRSRFVHWRDKLYLSIKNNIFVYNGNTVERVYSGDAPIISLTVDRDNNLWIGYINSGLESFNNDKFINSRTLSFFKDKSVTSVLQDNQKGLWITTLERGIYHIPNLVIKNHELTEDSKIIQVSSIGDSVFISNQQGVLEILHGVTRQNLWHKELNSPVQAFFISKRNKIFLYSDVHIYVLNSSLNIEKTYTGDALTFAEDAYGDIWTFGNQSTNRFNSEGERLSRIILPLRHRAFILHDSLFFLAGKTGLSIRNKNLKIIKSLEEFSDYKITGFMTLADTLLMVNTMGSGFTLLNTKTFKHQKFDVENNFIANNIYTAVKKDSVLWLGTEAGIVRLNTESLLKKRPVYSRWDKKNGLISNDIKFLAIAKQNVWAFSDNGYSIIPNELLKEQQKNPTPYLKRLVLNDSVFSKNEVPKTIKLPHDKTSVGIQVGYLSYKNQNIKSRYRLSKSTPWEYTRERSFQFTSLAPASYSFELEYSTDNIHWIPTKIDFNFVVTPPWWKLWYFQVGLTLLLMSMIFLYAWFQIKNYQQKNRLLNLVNTQQQKLVHAEINITERERKRIAKELHDGVGTSITAIKLGVMSQLTQHLQGNPKILEIENQFQNTLREIKDIAYDLTPPDLERYGLFTAINNYVNKVSSSVGKEIRVNIFGNDLPEGEMALSVFRVLQELISNSLKHAEATEISITINSFNDLMSIIFEDNGKGFDPSTVEKGLGLTNIESRIQLLNGTILLESTHYGVSYLIDIPINENNLD